jgi:Prp8 binding protein
MVEKRELVVQNQQEKRQKQLSQTKQEVYRPITRVSDLEAPIMQLSGHKAEVLTVQFSPDNQIIASAGFDKQILLWNLKCENYGLINTLGPVLQLKFSRDSKQLYGCSSDYTCSIYDLERGEIMKRFRGHKQIVNSIALNKRGQELLVSVSDDGSTKVWDQRQSHSIKSYESNSPLTACEFERDGTIVYSAGIDSKIRVLKLN